MKNPTILMFLVMFYALIGTYSCNQEKPNVLSKQDSVNVEMAVRLDLQSRQMDSLRTWVYEVEKDGRVAEKWAIKDNQRLVAKIDSFVRANPKESKFARFFGTLIGEVAKRTVPGL